jgi:hypothetical protein
MLVTTRHYKWVFNQAIHVNHIQDHAQKMSKMLTVQEHFQVHMSKFLDAPNEMSKSLIICQETEYHIKDMPNLQISANL